MRLLSHCSFMFTHHVMHFGEIEDVIQLQRVLVLVFGRGIVAIGAVPVVVGDRNRFLVEPAWDRKVKVTLF